ncbi:MAG: TonB-dependent receptor, partial [Bryobacteraceae bacterium]
MQRTLLLLFAVTLVTSAQTSLGTISGTVTDSSGASLPGAKVDLRNADTGASRSVQTDTSGFYTAPSLIPGPYVITVEAMGFRRQERLGVTLPVNEKVQADISLTVGDMKEAVQVTAEAPLLNTSNSTVSTVIDTTKIFNMPLNGRQFTQLILLAPGTSGKQPGASGLDNNLSGISPSVNGARPQNNNFTLDGADNNEAFFNSFSVSPSVDAIAEFKVQSNITSAEFGRAAGANINVSFRSGTNQPHGTLYEYLRNEKLDARNAFAQVRGPFKQNQYGGTFGGPVWIPKVYNGRNKTFFFFAAESMRQRRGLTPPTSLVPTAEQLAGNLSGGPQIYDPFSTRTDPANPARLIRDPFPGNIIPATRINKAATVIAQQFFPAPNYTGVPGRNYINAKSQAQDDDQWNLRLDEQITRNNQLFFRASLNDRERSAPTSLPRIDSILFNRNRNFLLSDTHVFNATTILDVKMALNRSYLATLNTPLDPAALFGQTGLQGYVVQSQTYPLFPIISITGFAGVSQDSTLFGPLNNFQYLGTITKVLGRHSFKAGGDIRRQQLFTGSYRAGNIGFDNIPTADPNDRGRTGQPLASYLMGLPSNAQRVVGDTNVRMRGSMLHFFLQDDYRVSSRLTLNIGLRYEYNQLPYDKNGRMSAFDLRNGNILFASKNPITGEPPNVRKNITDPDWNNVAPRFGFAYQLGRKMTIRSGYGIFYNSNFMQEQQGGRGQWPFALSQSDTNLNIDQPTRPLQNLFPVAPQSVISFSGTRAIAGRTSYTQQWNFHLQRQFSSNLVLEAGYVGTKGNKLYTNWRGNGAPPGPGAVNPRRPYPQFGTISEENPRGNSNFHSLQVKLEKRYSMGLTFLSSYTWSKSIDDSSTLTTLSQNNPFDLRQERGLSEFDQRHNSVTTFVYELPFGHGKALGANAPGIVNAIIGGWQLNGISTLRTGNPVRIVLSADVANTGVSGGQRPNPVGTLELPTTQRTADLFFNTAAL